MRQGAQYLVPFQKVEILYMHVIHLKSQKEISAILNLNYSTVMSVVRGYRTTGRIFKLLPQHSKQFILKHRLENLESQQLYRLYRKRLLEIAPYKTVPTGKNGKKHTYRWINRDSETHSVEEDRHPSTETRDTSRHEPAQPVQARCTIQICFDT